MAVVIEDVQVEHLAKQVAAAEGISIPEVLRESLLSLAGLRGLTMRKEAPLRERLAALLSKCGLCEKEGALSRGLWARRSMVALNHFRPRPTCSKRPTPISWRTASRRFPSFRYKRPALSNGKTSNTANPWVAPQDHASPDCSGCNPHADCNPDRFE